MFCTIEHIHLFINVNSTTIIAPVNCFKNEHCHFFDVLWILEKLIGKLSKLKRGALHPITIVQLNFFLLSK